MNRENLEQRHPFEELAEEFSLKVRNGLAPSIDDYVSKYPQWAEEIKAIFPSLLSLEQASSESPIEQDDSAYRTMSLDATLPLSQGTGSPHCNSNRPNSNYKDLNHRDSNHRDSNFADAHTSQRDSAPKSFDDFQIVRRIGHGGMGIVYEAIQRSLQRHVALKVINEAASSKEQHRQRFKREAEAAAGLHHTNIVPIYGIGEDHGLQYYAMQLIEGVTLADILESIRQRRRNPDENATLAEHQAGTLAERLVSGKPTEEFSQSAVSAKPPLHSTNSSASSGIIGGLPKHYFRNICRLMVKVANAIDYAHGAGVLHRDIKPSNLLLDKTGTIWVADFGLARREDLESHTQSGEILGTLRYMAPEQFRGISDQRSDIYALGLTLFELLTLAPAFSAPKQRLLDPTNHSNVVFGPQERRVIPSDLQTILLKACAFEPESRYQRAKDFEEDLKRFLDDRPILAKRASWLDHSLRWAKRNPAIASMATVVFGLLATLAILLALWIQQQRDSIEKLSSAYSQVAKGLNEKSAALQAAEEEEIRAERNLELALEAFETITDNVASRGVSFNSALIDSEDDGNASFSGAVLSVADVELLKSLQVFFERFAEENNTDLRFDAAIARKRVGEIERRIGKFDEATDSFAKALRDLGRLRSKLSDAESKAPVGGVADTGGNSSSVISIDAVVREELLCRESLIAIFSQRGMMPRAVAELEAAKRLLREYPKFGESDEGVFALASLLNQMSSASARLAFERLSNDRRRRFGGGLMQRSGGGKPDAVAPQQRMRLERDLIGNTESIGLLERLCTNESESANNPSASSNAASSNTASIKASSSESPSIIDYRLALARTYRDRMGLCRILGNASEADIAFEKAENSFKELMAHKQDSVVLKYELANLYACNLTNGSLDEKYLKESMKLVEEILSEQPSVPEYQTLFANLLVRSAWQDYSNNIEGVPLVERVEGSVAKFQQAISIHESLVERFPDIPVYSLHLLQATSQLSEYYGTIRRPERARQVMSQAVEIAEKLAKSGTSPPFVKTILERMRERRSVLENRQEPTKNP
jgi:serine/threonine protein kinase